MRGLSAFMLTYIDIVLAHIITNNEFLLFEILPKNSTIVYLLQLWEIVHTLEDVLHSLVLMTSSLSV